MGVIVWLIATALGGLLYHLGGTSAGTKWRDIGVPMVYISYLIYLIHKCGGLWEAVAILASAGALSGALCTYRYFLPKPADGYKWYHYALHGFFCGLAAAFYAYYGNVLGIAVRALALSAFMGALYFIPWKKTQEPLRGAAIIATIPWIV